jgi:hypothetical protein
VIILILLLITGPAGLWISAEESTKRPFKIMDWVKE